MLIAGRVEVAPVVVKLLTLQNGDSCHRNNQGLILRCGQPPPIDWWNAGIVLLLLLLPVMTDELVRRVRSSLLAPAERRQPALVSVGRASGGRSSGQSRLSFARGAQNGNC